MTKGSLKIKTTLSGHSKKRVCQKLSQNHQVDGNTPSRPYVRVALLTGFRDLQQCDGFACRGFVAFPTAIKCGHSNCPSSRKHSGFRLALVAKLQSNNIIFECFTVQKTTHKKKNGMYGQTCKRCCVHDLLPPVFLSSPASNARWTVVCILALSQQSDHLSLAAALTMSQIMLKETGNLRSNPLGTK